MIYLDNAATTFPKPEQVYKAAERSMRTKGGNPGRSGHALSASAMEEVYACREKIARFFGGVPENAVFTLNATYALNMAINSLYRGGEVIISNIDHNAALRPVNAVTGGRYRIFDGIGSRDSVLASFMSKLTPRTALAVCNHVSNLCGVTLPVDEIGKICRARGIRLIVDVSQSAGIKSIDIKKMQADAICAPAHKGLYGIMGCGFVLFSDKYRESADMLSEFVRGGNGVNSYEPTMPDFLPERFEAGTLPVPAISALSAGISEIERIGVMSIEKQEERLSRLLKNELMSIGGVKVYKPELGGGTVLFNVDGMTPEEVTEQLDSAGICVRGGLHCCPLGHKALNTGKNGAVRASFSIFNTERDVRVLVDRIYKIKMG